LGDDRSYCPRRASIGLHAAGDTRQEIEQVRRTDKADDLSRPTSRTGGSSVTKGLHRTDQGTPTWLTNGLEIG